MSDKDETEKRKVLSTTTVVRQARFVSPTPMIGVERVVCYEDTFTQHIPLERHLVLPLQSAGTQTLMNPSAVVEGTSNPGYHAFVNFKIASPNNKSPFVVFVDPSGNPMPAVATMGFRKDFKDLSAHRILMLGKKEGDDE